MSNDKPLISFDYAIKYLLKDKGDYAIVEGFISALLKTKGYKDVKIVALLEVESNKEDSKSKRSLADVIVEDEDHHKYIIEIERNVKDSFIHKACFNTSRLIVDNLAQREDYTQIIKIFHISLLYFPIGNGNGVIYHGKTIIHEIETNERLNVHIKNMETFEVFDATDILPEYFYISVPLFNDRLEKEIDDWLHVMKYDKVPPNYHSPYMSQVADKLNILKMTKEERANYSYYQKKLYNDRDELQVAEARGAARGAAREKIVIAKNLLQAGLSIDVIAESTGLSIEEIQKLTLVANEPQV
ncbi:Rpn family recombination-promoting nuclease/putative transposase [Candidatus Tisiphia endosymbiont of Myopa tessellatipennis]|uniref:Rpn family recombination-promoting nuclease/putative transposase n=1 Tax=Candidatus Tisiphia endosymbiont of Myopa tessellatipennis TaxID=3066257 RepID=UPI00313BB5E5